MRPIRPAENREEEWDFPEPISLRFTRTAVLKPTVFILKMEVGCVVETPQHPATTRCTNPKGECDFIKNRGETYKHLWSIVEYAIQVSNGAVIFCK